MPSLLPKLSSSICRRLLPVTALPILLVGLICWGLMVSSANRSERNRHQRITTSVARVLSQRLNAIESLLLQTSVAAEALGRADRAPVLAASVQSAPSVHALLILSPDCSVRDVAMRSDLSALRENLVGMDFSRLLAAMDRLPQSHLAHGPRSPIDGTPLLAGLRELSTGETVLALLDVGALCNNLHDPADGDYELALWAPDCSLVLHSGSSSSALLANIQNGPRTATTVPAHITEDRHLLASSAIQPGGLLISVAGHPAGNLAITGNPLIALIVTGSACLIAAIASLFVGIRLSRPIGSLSAQIRDAVARQEETTLPSQSFVETESIAHTARQLVIGCRDTQDRLATIQQAIQTASAPLARAPESSPLSQLAAALASVTGARCVLIAEWIAGTKPRAHVLAAHANVPLPKDLTYELSGNPSQRISSSPLVHVRTRVLREYPESPLLRMLGAEGYVCVPLFKGDGQIGGHLEIIDDQDIVLTDSLRDLLALFAARAAGEIERIHAARERRETEALYSSVTLDQREPICRWAADTTLTFVNDALCRLAEIPRDQLLGRSLLTLLHSDDRELFQQRMRELSSAAPTCELELRLISGKGPRWHRWTGRALLDEKGRIIEYQGTAREISEIRELLESLDDAQLRFSVIADNCPVAFWITDWTTQRCVYCNPAFRALWGISPDVARSVSMAWTSVVHEEDRAQVVRKYLLHAAEGQYQASYRILRPNSSPVTIRDRAIPLRDRAGRVNRIANIAYEISPDSPGFTTPPDEFTVVTPTAS